MRWGLAAKALVGGMLLAGQAAAQVKVGESVSFVACPIAQDTGPEADLCFFVEYRGERFSVETQTFDSTGPMLRHKMLVEGTVIAADRDCGGLRLEGMTSALTEISLECNEVRPFDVRFAPPAGNSGQIAELVARVKADPGLSVRPAPSGVPDFTGPVPKDWQMLYTFDSDRGEGPALQTLVALVQAATKEKAASISVHGYRASARLDNGEILEEPSRLAQQRAQKIAGIIAGLGYPKDRIKVAWTEASPTPDGRTDWKQRRVTVKVAQ